MIAPIDIVEEEIVSWRVLLNKRDREISGIRRRLARLEAEVKAKKPPAAPIVSVNKGGVNERYQITDRPHPPSPNRRIAILMDGAGI